jgi:DNA polymerase elongation subunit (family B)
MALYKKFTANEDASYALNAIAKKELGKTKIAYEGTLNDLYRNDIKKFIDYNLTDVVLVKELDDKLRYIDLVRNICHKGNVPYNAIYMPSKYLEGAALTYMKRNGIIANNVKKSAYATAENEGAYVKVPIRGRHEWIYSIDLQSLYPSLIMTLNISPETKIAKIRSWSKVNFMFKLLNPNSEVDANTVLILDMIDGSEIKMTLTEVKAWIQEHQFTVASNGVIYRTDKKGLLPAILELWFDERVQYKNKMKEYERAGDSEQAAYYDQRQYVQKIMLNSFYGVLGARGFRFRDNDNAEAITLSGQDVIQFTNEIVNRYYEKRFQVSGDQAIYADTDSLYIKAVPGIPNFAELTPEQRIESIRSLAEEVTDFVNEKLVGLAAHHMNSKYCKLLFKQEALASACFFVAKKRYAYKKVYDLEVNKPANKLVVKGLDVVRSNFPPLFRTFMSQVLDKLLTGTDRAEIDAMSAAIKQEMLTADILDILKPTGVNELDKWHGADLNFKKGTPVHVKAALCYNFLLKKFNLDKRYPPIIEGEKVKWAYLKQNFYGIDALAIKGYDDPKQILKFISENVDYDDIYESNLQRKLQDFYDAMDWGLTDANNNLDNFFSW